MQARFLARGEAPASDLAPVIGLVAALRVGLGVAYHGHLIALYVAALAAGFDLLVFLVLPWRSSITRADGGLRVVFRPCFGPLRFVERVAVPRYVALASRRRVRVLDADRRQVAVVRYRDEESRRADVEDLCAAFGEIVRLDDCTGGPEAVGGS